MNYSTFLKIYIILTIYINYSYTFDANLYPILKKLFDNKYINNKYNKNYYSREEAKYYRRFRLSKYMIDDTASNIVGPKYKIRNNISNVSNSTKDFTRFLQNFNN
tara:strand:+ start:2625 stop:2939 length:315 start_codon:yes stop_codon:yes gene_type:complete